jgi:hypothetical protein
MTKFLPPAYCASGGTRACQSVEFCQAQPMRSASASSPPRQTICNESGNPDWVNPLGTASPQRSRKLTQRVKTRRRGALIYRIEGDGEVLLQGRTALCPTSRVYQGRSSKATIRVDKEPAGPLRTLATIGPTVGRRGCRQRRHYGGSARVIRR